MLIHNQIFPGREASILCIPEKETVAQLHDVRLVHTRHLLAPVSRGVIEGKLGDAPRLFRGDNLQAFDHSRDRLMLQGRIFALRLFSDHHHVQVLVP